MTWVTDLIEKQAKRQTLLEQFRQKRAERLAPPRRVRFNPFRDEEELPSEDTGNEAIDFFRRIAPEGTSLIRQPQTRLTLGELLGQRRGTRTALATRAAPALSARRETPSFGELLRQRPPISAVSERVTAPFRMPEPIPISKIPDIAGGAYRPAEERAIRQKLGVAELPPVKAPTREEIAKQYESYFAKLSPETDAGGNPIPQWQRELSGIGMAATLVGAGAGAVVAGWRALTNQALIRQVTRRLTFGGAPPSQEQAQAIANDIRSSAQKAGRGWELDRRALRSFFKSTGKGNIAPTEAGVRKAEAVAQRAITQYAPVLAPKGTQTGAMAFGGLPKKQPWQIVKTDFITQGLKTSEAEKLNVAEGIKLNIPMIRQQIENQHRQLVSDAIREGKPVPAEVLKDYPDLAPVTPAPEVTELTEWTNEELIARRKVLENERYKQGRTAGTIQPSDEENRIYQEQLRRHKETVVDFNKRAIEATGLNKGDRVSYFAPNVFGTGGSTYTGTVIFDRNGRLAVRLDQAEGGGRKIVAVNKGFKKIEVKPTARKGKRLLSPQQISDFRVGIDKVVREGNRTFVIDAEGVRKKIEVQSDVMTPEFVANRAKLTPEQNAKMIEAIKTTPYLSDEGRAERLAVIKAEESALLGAEPVTPAPEVTGVRDKLLNIFLERIQTKQDVPLDFARLTRAGLELRISELKESQVKELAERYLPKAEAVPEAPAKEAVTAKPQAGKVPPVKPPTEPPVETATPPPGDSASKRVFDRIQFEPAETGLMEKLRQGYHQFQVKMVDDLYALKKFTEQATQGGVDLSLEENPYYMARLLRGIAGKANVFIENGTFGKTFWKMEKGKAVPNYTGESLENILKEVRKPDDWQDFSVYLVARRSVELGKRNIKTGISTQDANGTIREQVSKHKNFPELAQRVYKYQDNLLVYAREMGLLSEDLLVKLRKYGNYVPFYRVMNELQAKGLMGKKMANIANPIKKIKGSEREIINPLESIIKNTYVLVSAADRNQIGIMIANLVDKNPELANVFERVRTPIARVAGVTAKELGVEIEGLSKADAEAVVDIFRPSFFTRGDEITVLIDGKKAHYRVDQDLRDALLNLDRETLGFIGKIFGAPARLLRAGATLSPDFMVRNPMRDGLSAFVYSEYGFLPGIDTIRGLAEAITKGADYQLFRMSGAEHSMLVSMDREYLSKTFEEVVEGKGFTNYIKDPMELMRLGSELGERATRLGEFKAGIRRGALPLAAGYSGRVVSLDFSQAGTTARAINQLIAFFNAQIRGTARPFSAFKEHPKRMALKVFLGITLPSILLYYANRDDPRWKEIPQWQKDLSWIVFLKSLPENWETMSPKERADYLSLSNTITSGIYRIPKPFELGILFGSVPERFLEWLDNKDPELMKDVLVSVAEAGTPGIIPTAGLPILEWMTNYSFFRGTKIVPASREKMPAELQYTAYTSEFSKKIGELIKQPPAKIDNLINGYTAGLGRYAVDALDGILKRTGIVADIPEPSSTLADIPVLKAFVVRSPYGSSGATVEKFYDTLAKFEEGEKYLKEMMTLGEERKFEKYKEKHPELLFSYDFSRKDHYSASARYLRRVGRDLTELRKKQDEIYKDRAMSSEEKRKLIDEIDFLKTDVARKALSLILDEEKDRLEPSPLPATAPRRTKSNPFRNRQ